MKKNHLNPVALVCDMGASNIELARKLGVTPENIKCNFGETSLFFFFDPPNLLKAVRNMMYTNQFIWEDQHTNWQYIKTLYEIDQTQTNKRSDTVANALRILIKLKEIPTDACGTINFI